MTESIRLQEMEAADAIQLENVQPRVFWVVQIALWSLWLVDGLRAIDAAEADWMDWSKVCASVLVVALGGHRSH